MIRYIPLLVSSLLTILLASCLPAVPDPAALAATAEHFAATWVAATLTNVATETPMPTATLTQTQSPTQTETSASPQITATQTFAAAAGTLANEIPTAVSDEDQTDKSDNQTYLLLQNNSDQVIWLIIDSPIYLEYRFSDSFGFLVSQGDYHYRVYIGTKGPIEGTFHIGNQDKHTMVFSTGKVNFQGP